MANYPRLPRAGRAARILTSSALAWGIFQTAPLSAQVNPADPPKNGAETPKADADKKPADDKKADDKKADDKKADDAEKKAETDKDAKAISKSVLRSELPTIPLAECLRIARDRQPALAAARASLAARETAHHGIAALNPPLQRIFAPDLDIRVKQSYRGVAAAKADLIQAEFDTAYSVERMYVTAIYAQQQHTIANAIVERIEKKLKDSEAFREAGDVKYGAEVLIRANVYLHLAKTKRTEALVGFDRALAGLREAMGVGFDCPCSRPVDLELPEIALLPCREQIVELAIHRRGEIVQAIVAADVTRLEVDAQGRFCFRSLVRTFASSSDIHAKSLPTGLHNGQYKPGAVGIEFPGNLAGQKPYRMAQASSYADRMGSVVDKTRGLVTLEAEDGFLKWREATDKVADARKAAEVGDQLAKTSARDSTKDKDDTATKLEPDVAVRDFVLAGQARAAFNEALFEQVLALINLERITAGGFCAGLGTPIATSVMLPAPPVPPATVTPAPAAAPVALPDPSVPAIVPK